MSLLCAGSSDFFGAPGMDDNEGVKVIVLTRGDLTDVTVGACLEKKLLLKVNTDKSYTTTVYAQKFKFLSFTLGKNGEGIHVRVHPKALRKCKQKLKVLTRRNRGRSVRNIMEQSKVYIRGWLGYFYIAKTKRLFMQMEECLRRRLRMYIWKQWKKPRTKVKTLRKLGIPPDKAYEWSNMRLGYWRIAHSTILQRYAFLNSQTFSSSINSTIANTLIKNRYENALSKSRRND